MTMLALAGTLTSRIELGTAVVPTYPRHPTVLMQQAMTVQVASKGRLSLGIGPSHKPAVEDSWGLSYDRPGRHTREYLTVLNQLVEESAGELFGRNVPGPSQLGNGWRISLPGPDFGPRPNHAEGCRGNFLPGQLLGCAESRPSENTLSLE